MNSASNKYFQLLDLTTSIVISNIQFLDEALFGFIHFENIPNSISFTNISYVNS